MPITRRDLDALQGRLGHVFTDRALLDQALTHVSGVRTGNARLGSYQRLEFLGDRVLGVIVAQLLFETYPSADEGELSRRLAELVRRETCAEVATRWQLGPQIRLGAGEAQSGGRRKETILADVCEAVIGAVYLDGGAEAARAVVANAWADRLQIAEGDRRDAKTMLQEWSQARGAGTPVYREISRQGPDHALEFTIETEIIGVSRARGQGRSKRDAEQAAARNLLIQEGVIAGDPEASP
jgi:ribonuclease-3